MVDVKREARRALAKYEKANGKTPRKRKWKPALGALEDHVAIAEKFVEMFGDEILFVPGVGWLVWADTHWLRDATGKIVERVKALLKLLRHEAAELGDEHLWKLVTRVSTKRGIESIASLAESDPRVVVPVDKLDRHHHLLACPNGTVNVRTGELGPSDPAHLITRCIPTEYESGATHEDFDRVLRHVVPDDTARDFSQKAAGYSLTGETREDVIFLAVGPERSGKTTLIHAFQETLGEQYAQLNMSSLCVDKRGSGPPGARSDLFRLIGRRFVAASEIHPGQFFDSGRIKSIAGGETMPVRQLYKGEIEARVTFKLWLVANDGDLPRLRPEDNALWERVRMIPVGSTIPPDKRDTALREGMSRPEVRRAVLAWMVQGSKRWYAEGLGNPPACVTSANESLRGEMDDLGPFFVAHCVFEPNAVTAKSMLRDELEEWLDGDPLPHPKRLASALRSRAAKVGVEVAETTTSLEVGMGPNGPITKKVRAWRGVRFVG